MGKRITAGLLGIWNLCLLAGSICYAEAAEKAEEEAFRNLNWKLLYEDQIIGNIQSVCATEDYIITIDNVSDSPTDKDIVSAYYKNDVDENGNPVEKYSLAKRAADRCWEHGNGMTYNFRTHEVYVALYTNSIPENRGCIYVMDPDTLAYKRTVKISDAYNVLGIDYMADTDQYVIQTNIEGGYSFKILDADFQLVEDLGEYAGTGMGPNFQDLAVTGDYIFNFPLTLDQGVGDYLHVYSISKRTLIGAFQIDFGFEDVQTDEPESLCEIEPGVYLSVVNVIKTDGARKVRFYQVELPSSQVTPRSSDSVPQTSSSIPFSDQAAGAACLGSGAIVMYLYYAHMKMERKRKELRTKRRRRWHARKG